MTTILLRTVALTLLLVATVGLFTIAAGVGQLILGSQQDELSRDAETLNRLQSHMRSLEARAGDKTAANVDQLSQHFLEGADDNLILAALQSKLRSMILENSGELVSARNLPVLKDERGTQLGLGLQLRGEVGRVQEILYSIESGSPYLWIRRAALRLDERAGPIKAAGQNAPKLIVEIDVYGTKWAGPAKGLDLQKAGPLQ